MGVRAYNTTYVGKVYTRDSNIHHDITDQFDTYFFVHGLIPYIKERCRTFYDTVQRRVHLSRINVNLYGKVLESINTKLNYVMFTMLYTLTAYIPSS